ncbi:MAG: glycoside hydrolase family 140 protein [Bacteroidia bacterium]|nr:glycoside hydrolase family 140 protein [Bacteroidia bacterium]
MKRISLLLLMVFVGVASLPAQLPWVKTSKNGRFLVTEDGKPFFYLGDTAWELFHRLSREEMDLYFRDRAAKGFTVVQSVVLGELNGVTEPNAEGHLPFEGTDVTRPNEAFFELVDYAVGKAAEYGIYMAILPTWGAHVEDKPHPLFDNVSLFTPETAFSYGKYLGDRLKHHDNIIWIFGGDRGPEGYENIWDRMALGTHKGDGGRLMTYHIYGGRSSGEVLHEAAWLDFNMLQSGHMHPGAPNYEMIARDYARTPAKPVLDGEPNYEGIRVGFNEVGPKFEDFDVRRAAYWSVFAGGCGITYGHNSIWQMYDKGREPIIYADIYWREAMAAPGSAQLQYLKNLMLSRPYLSRIPDQSVLQANGPSWPAEGVGANHIQATRDGTPGGKDATYLMVYYPYPYSISINTQCIAGENLKVWWYNPRNGMSFFNGVFPNTGTFSLPWGKRLRKDMGGPDWVLVIDDAAKEYGKPGEK